MPTLAIFQLYNFVINKSELNVVLFNNVNIILKVKHFENTQIKQIVKIGQEYFYILEVSEYLLLVQCMFFTEHSFTRT
jgi:hypothetical protein